jgi:hypothetical protein
MFSFTLAAKSRVAQLFNSQLFGFYQAEIQFGQDRESRDFGRIAAARKFGHF